MQLITAPIRSRDIGPEVANLQDALTLFLNRGLLLAAEETARRKLSSELVGERFKQNYQKATRKLVAIFQEEQHISVTTKAGYVDEPTAAVMNGFLRQLGALDQLSKLVVNGRVVNSTHTGLPHHTVTLSEYDLSGLSKIEAAATKEDGTFEIIIKDEAVLQQDDDKTGLDLVFQVLDPNTRELSVRSIAILRDGKEQTVPRLADNEQAPIVLINVDSSLMVRVVAATTNHTPTEFELLVARLTPFMQQVAFADLKEDDQNFQISFLHKETGAEKEKIERLRDAFQKERESQSVPAWAFYGLTINEISWDAVRLMPDAQLVSALNPLQPSDHTENLETVANNLKQWATDRNIAENTTGLKEHVGELLKPLLGSEEKLGRFLDAYARHKGDIAEFWKDMRDKQEFKEMVPKIQLNLQLAQLTLNNKGLVNALQGMGITNTRQLANLPLERWDDLAAAHLAELPVDILGDDDVARAKTYARQMQTLVEVAFPTDVIKNTIDHPEVKTFLGKHPEFDFTKVPLEPFFQEKGQVAFQGFENSESVKNDLRTIQRLYTLTANAVDMQILREAGYQSAYQIAKLSLADF